MSRELTDQEVNILDLGRKLNYVNDKLEKMQEEQREINKKIEELWNFGNQLSDLFKQLENNPMAQSLGLRFGA